MTNRMPTSLSDPSFVAALVFCVFATVLLIGYARITILTNRRNAESPRGRSLLLPLAALLLSICLLLAYVLRAIGTRHQQVTEFVAFSDTLVLMSPICESSALVLCSVCTHSCTM